MTTNKTTTTQINRKLVAVGDGMAGKTCLLFAFKDANFDPTHPPTIFETYATQIDLDGRRVSNYYIYIKSHSTY
jgi:GTPase SAR1 family protein